MGGRWFAGEEAGNGTFGGIERDASDGDFEFIEQRLDILFAGEPALGKPATAGAALFVIRFEVIAKLGFAVEFHRVGFSHSEGFLE